MVSGVATGTTTITYTLSTGCSTTTPVTINPLPAAIGGASTVCVGTTMTLTDGTPGGTWSRSNTNVGIGSATGMVTGVTSGITIITYTLPTGCYMTKTITINTTAGAITGSLQVCPGTTTALSDPTGGGTWNSSAPTIATIGSSTGIVSGIATGTTNISYSTGSGCVATATVTVNALPTIFTVTGGGGYCAGGTGLHIGLSGSVTGVTYQLYNGTVAIRPAPGGTGGALDFGLQTMAGTYTVIADVIASGCTRAMTGGVTITINPLPTAISGPSAVCVGSTIAETDPGGGTWLSSAPSIATIGSSTGITAGVAIGTTAITYTLPTTCYIIKTVTVSVSPIAISGVSAVCAGDSISLTDAVGGGAWSSAITAIATVGSSTGVVSGVAAGATSITYSLGTGCAVFKTISVNAMPAAITGSMTLCAGHTTTLSSITTGGTWTSGATTIASVGSTTGVVSGITAGTAGITYTMAAGCSATATVTVNTVPTAITGVTHVCMGLATTLSDGVTGGTWTSSAPGIATVGSSTGIVTGVTAGIATITYSLGSGCSVSTSVTVNALPLAIGGASAVCTGATATATDGSTGGTWSCPSTGVATIGSSTGLITGVSAGMTTISYTTGSGCMSTKPVTVNALPSAITGATTACVSQTTTLSDATTGGAWSSSNTVIATVGSGTGIVTGVAAGTATITYTLPTGCMATKMVTVNPPPSPITGVASVCVGATTTLSDAVAGGTWSSGATTIAMVGTSSGIVTGVTAGTAVISYAIGSGCSAIKAVTVNALPPTITGSATACVGATTTLSDTITGGAWSSSNTAIATVGSGTGIVSGVSAGTAIITYATSAGCITTLWMTVNPLPPVITGSSGVCSGSTIMLGDPATGGSWSSSNTSIATVSTTGVVTGGTTGGSVTISYMVSTGCAATHTVSVTAVPAITGLHNLCAWGDTLTAHDAK